MNSCVAKNKLQYISSAQTGSVASYENCVQVDNAGKCTRCATGKYLAGNTC